MNTALKKLIPNSENLSSNDRLKLIAELNLGEASECAKRVLIKRKLRLKLINDGYSKNEAYKIVTLMYKTN